MIPKPKLGRLLPALRQAVTGHRLLFAGKTAVAAGLAWYLAPLMPGSAAAYPYYAPLGVLVSMHPTVAASAKHGLQSLLGLGLGIAMAFAVTTVTAPTALAVAVVVGLGVVIGGLPRLGSASEWVPMAALFVLVLGYSNAQGFSFAYVLQMAMGVAVGFALNWLVFPPLHLEGIDPAIDGHQRALSKQLRDMASAMTESWPPDHEDWASRSGELARTATAVRTAVQAAKLSAKANPRSRRRAGRLPGDLAGLRAVERLTFHVQDVTDVLASVIWEEDAGTVIPEGVPPNLAKALEDVAAAIRQWRHADAEDLKSALDEARDSVAALSDTLTEAAAGQVSVNATASVAMSLRRIITVVSDAA
ncbi:FUSC family protein [Arthrobacter sp. B2a2-09]|uniref:FUSC family protein n=1 Tax=Arthrobacter sp. B2a2-09 TaxID=2952822 RepID=UPI0022CD3ECD|nr:aromatic acid exporter family protein [Arthrobacter sp. B2a2-09]MCZ9884787.1 aromatic acid exporter family protein [Arthrobacter sp. B2a2-09]